METFEPAEKLFRAVYPPSHPGMFWKKDGTLSTAAFADAKGLSVDRGFGRKDEDAVAEMRRKFTGCIVSVNAKQCWDVDAVVEYLPSKSNRYHSEIHGGKNELLLSKHQRFYLANNAVVEYMEAGTV